MAFLLSFILLLPGFAAVIAVLAGQWMVYTKLGKPGWACLIPIYSTYVLFDALYDNGLLMLWCFVPVMNIYWAVKANLDLAHKFGKDTAFGVGLVLLAPIFLCILGFSKSEVPSSASK